MRKIFLLIGLLFLLVPAVSAQDIVLDDTFTHPVSDFTFRYPKEWRILEQEDDYVQLQAARDFEVLITLIGDTYGSPRASMADFLDFSLPDSPDFRAGEVSELIIGGYYSQQVDITHVDNPLYKNIMVHTLVDERVFTVIVYLSRSAERRHMEIVYALIATLDLPNIPELGTVSESGNPELPQRFTSEDGKFHFNFPADWHVIEVWDSEIGAIRLYGISEQVGYVELQFERVAEYQGTLLEYLEIDAGKGVLFDTSEVSTFSIGDLTGIRYETFAERLEIFNQVKYAIDPLNGSYWLLTANTADLADPSVEALIQAVLLTVESRGSKRLTTTDYDALITDVEITNQYDGDNILFSFGYPANWDILEVIDERTVALSSLNNDIAIIGVLPDQIQGIQEILDLYMEEASKESYENLEQELFMINGRLAGRITGENDDSERYIAMIIQSNGRYAYLVGIFPPDDLDQADLYALLGAIEAPQAIRPVGTVSASGNPQLPNRYLTSDGEYIVDFPDGWDVIEETNGNTTGVTLILQEDRYVTVDLFFIDYTPNLVEAATLLNDAEIFNDMEITEFESAGRRALRVQLSTESGTLDYTVLAVDLGDNRALLISGLTFEMNENDVADLLPLILDSARPADKGDAPVANPTQTSGASCTVTAISNANQRSGPGVNFAVQQSLAQNTSAQAVGQFTAADGFVWWQLENGNWVRADVVNESSECESLPQVQP